MSWVTALFRRIFPVKRIVDHSRRRSMPERLPLHWAYACLIVLATIAALWRYGHPGFTILVLVLTPFAAALAYVPYRIVPSWCRLLLQLALLIGAGFWSMVRLKAGIPVDKALVELLALAVLMFLMAQRVRDYGYVFAISILLLVYGALLPRTIYLWCFGVGVGLVLVLLYNNRLRQLGRAPVLENPHRILRRNWHIIGVHLGLSLLFFLLIFPLFPTIPSDTKGIFSVSFAHEKESLLPPDLRHWFESEKVLRNASGERIVRSGRPDSLGMDGMPIALKGEQPDQAVNGAGGSAPPGENLVFRVKSPLKLYHLAQLYDEYDGNGWRVSAELKRGRLRRRGDAPELYRNVVSRYTILRWISPKLYSPYRPLSFEQAPGAEYNNLATTFYNSELTAEHYPRLPFVYTVTSRLSTDFHWFATEEEDGKRKVGGRHWEEVLPPRHYLQLPEEKISARLREKVRELTEGISSRYGKAMVLRDYLRDNFTYEQFSKPVPEGREGADYFVFELKEGHCEYFASTLAVMARLAGLPARVATGFSPGDYNTLLNLFEVYERHAHAWTQIFVPEYGWLTVDATPPGAVQSRTTPLGIGQLRDPFGDEWRVTPPELTSHTLQTLRDLYLKQLRLEGETSQAAEMMMQVAKMEEELRNKVQETYRKVAPKAQTAKKIGSAKHPPGSFSARLANLVEKGKRAFRSLTEQLRIHRWEAGCIATVLAAFFLLTRMMVRQFRLNRLRRRMLANLTQAAGALKSGEFRRSVDASYRAARYLLLLAGAPSRGGRELLDYAAVLEKFQPGLEELLKPVFLAFYETEYGEGEAVSRRSAVLTLRRVRALRRRLASFSRMIR